VNDCCLTSTQQFISYAKFQWDDDGVRFVLNQHAWIFIVLAHWNNNPWIDMSPQIFLSQSFFCSFS